MRLPRGRVFKHLANNVWSSLAANRAPGSLLINRARITCRSTSSSRFSRGYSILCCFTDASTTCGVNCMYAISCNRSRSSSIRPSCDKEIMESPPSQMKLKELVNGQRKIKDEDESCKSNYKLCDTTFDSKMGYERAIRELHRLISNMEDITKAIKSTNTRHERQLSNIANMNRFIRRSGLSEKDVDKLSIIHVSGTKGKGSTCAFVERILRAKGYKTGFFSSPHLVEVRERFRINGRPISRDTYVKHFWKTYSKLRETETDESDMPAYFAFSCVLALHIFLAEAVDVVIMEVGIGGEYDSTNFIRKPAACGVTSLGLDHTALLGNTLDKIAWNKGGIFKNGRPALTVSQNPVCLDVLLNRAKERKSPFHVVPQLSKQLLEKGNFRLGISGAKQTVNASLAIQLTRQWEKTQHTDLLPCNVDSITAMEDIPLLPVTELTASEIEGLRSCVWPGRAQSIKRPGITYYLDGAHTCESMEVCCEWFNKASKEEEKSISGKVVRILLFNVTGARNISAILSTLKRYCDFDAAVFSTNSVSTIAAYNVADQATKFDANDMVRKVESNQALWDSLVNGDAVVDNNNSYEYSSSHQDGHFPNGGNAVKTGSLSSCPTFTTMPDGNYTPPMKKGHFSADAAVPTLLQSTIGTASAVSSNSKANLARRISTTVTTADSVATNTTSATQSVPCPEVVRTNSGKGGESQNLSFSFPCVLHALSWATQTRDPGVVVKDLDAAIPAIPEVLRDASHIQVLATGSLHLVGAVLAVLEPNMND